MPLIAKSNDSEQRELIPQDFSAARCYSIVDPGKQQSPFGAKRQVLVAWELPTDQQNFDATQGPEPSGVSRFFMLSLGEKSNLRHVLESWRGRAFTQYELEGFDVTQVLEAPCLIQVLHKSKANGELSAVVGSVGKLPKGLAIPDQRNSNRLFLFDSFTEADFQALPEWQRNIVMQATEYSHWIRRVNGHDEHDPRQLYEPEYSPDTMMRCPSETHTLPWGAVDFLARCHPADRIMLSARFFLANQNYPLIFPGFSI